MWWWREAANESGTIDFATFLKKVIEAVTLTLFPKENSMTTAKVSFIKTKSVFASTTMWFNSIVVIVEALQGSGIIKQVVPPEYVVPTAAVINLFLRWFKTAGPVSISAPLSPPPSG